MLERGERREILLTGATGFIGRSIYPELERRGYEIRCASRNPGRAKRRWPDRRWVEMDVEKPESVVRALRGCDAAYYLIHQMADAEDFEERETRAAMTFADVCKEMGMERIIYLGGLKPRGEPARHLRSRLVTGAILRSSGVPTVELRASVIIGHGSASWQILRDIAMRLPVMVAPRWLRNRTEPVAIDDVKVALVKALEIELETSRWYAIPGPEVLTFQECIERVCALVENRPLMVNVPLLTPRLSSYWLRLVTGANYHLAKALAEGLKDDLLADSDEYWHLIGHEKRLGFDTAARRALAAEKGPRSGVERVVHTVVDRRRRLGR